MFLIPLNFRGSVHRGRQAANWQAGSNPGIPGPGIEYGIAGPKRRRAPSPVLTAPPLPVESDNQNGLVPALSVEIEVACFKGL